ncbi:uncharacterized protein LOC144381408 [Halichoerus grypus]
MALSPKATTSKRPPGTTRARAVPGLPTPTRARDSVFSCAEAAAEEVVGPPAGARHQPYPAAQLPDIDIGQGESPDNKKITCLVAYPGPRQGLSGWMQVNSEQGQSAGFFSLISCKE